MLEQEAARMGLLLRLQVRRPLNCWTLRLVVAENLSPTRIQMWGEMKAWAYGGKKGLQLDTMRVNPRKPEGVSHLIWAATMAWALDCTPCKEARLLAIHDEDRRHIALSRYFRLRGFHLVREVGAAPKDLPLRMVWGGSGSLMIANCQEVLEKSYLLWRSSCLDRN